MKGLQSIIEDIPPTRHVCSSYMSNNNTRIWAYIHDNFIRFVDHNFIYICSLRMNHMIDTISWCSTSGRLAVAMNGVVELYNPPMDERHVKNVDGEWIKLEESPTLWYECTALQWTTSNTLMIGGPKNVSAWENGHKALWRLHLADCPIISTICCSTDGVFYAIISNMCVKVIYKRYAHNQYTITSCSLLHLTPVLNIDWCYGVPSEEYARHSDEPYKQKYTLFTLAEDGIIRIWTSIDDDGSTTNNWLPSQLPANEIVDSDDHELSNNDLIAPVMAQSSHSTHRYQSLASRLKRRNKLKSTVVTSSMLKGSRRDLALEMNNNAPKSLVYRTIYNLVPQSWLKRHVTKPNDLETTRVLYPTSERGDQLGLHTARTTNTNNEDHPTKQSSSALSNEYAKLGWSNFTIIKPRTDISAVNDSGGKQHVPIHHSSKHIWFFAIDNENIIHVYRIDNLFDDPYIKPRVTLRNRIHMLDALPSYIIDNGDNEGSRIQSCDIQSFAYASFYTSSNTKNGFDWERVCSTEDNLTHYHHDISTPKTISLYSVSSQATMSLYRLHLHASTSNAIGGGTCTLMNIIGGVCYKKPQQQPFISCHKSLPMFATAANGMVDIFHVNNSVIATFNDSSSPIRLGLQLQSSVDPFQHVIWAPSSNPTIICCSGKHIVAYALGYRKIARQQHRDRVTVWHNIGSFHFSKQQCIIHDLHVINDDDDKLIIIITYTNCGKTSCNIWDWKPVDEQEQWRKTFVERRLSSESIPPQNATPSAATTTTPIRKSRRYCGELCYEFVYNDEMESKKEMTTVEYIRRRHCSDDDHILVFIAYNNGDIVLYSISTNTKTHDIVSTFNTSTCITNLYCMYTHTLVTLDTNGCMCVWESLSSGGTQYIKEYEYSNEKQIHIDLLDLNDGVTRIITSGDDDDNSIKVHTIVCGKYDTIWSSGSSISLNISSMIKHTYIYTLLSSNHVMCICRTNNDDHIIKFISLNELWLSIEELCRPILPYHPFRLMENIICGNLTRVRNIFGYLTQTLNNNNSDVIVPSVEYLLGTVTMMSNDDDDNNNVVGGIELKTNQFNDASGGSGGGGGGGFDMSSFGSFGAATTTTATSNGGGGFDMSSFGSFGAATTTTTTTTQQEDQVTKNTIEDEKQHTTSTIPTTSSIMLLSCKDNGLNFNENEVYTLSNAMSKVLLPHLTSFENMQVLSIVNTINKVKIHSSRVDGFGQRYLVFMEMYMYMIRMKQSKMSIAYFEICWALHSHSEIQLLSIMYPSVFQQYQSSSSSSSSMPLSWGTLRRLGVGYWIKSDDILYKLCDALARAQYQKNKNPNEAMLLYIALNRKQVLLGLFKVNPKYLAVWKFLSNDFTNDRWKQAAVKNAFRAVQKKKYYIAAAFFLLGDCLKDCLTICIRELKDIQLAIVICRLVKNKNDEVYNEIVNDALKQAINEGLSWWIHICHHLLNNERESIEILIKSLQTYENFKTFRSIVFLQHLIPYSSIANELITPNIIHDAKLKASYYYQRRGACFLSMDLYPLDYVDKNNELLKQACIISMNEQLICERVKCINHETNNASTVLWRDVKLLREYYNQNDDLSEKFVTNVLLKYTRIKNDYWSYIRLLRERQLSSRMCNLVRQELRTLVNYVQTCEFNVNVDFICLITFIRNQLHDDDDDNDDDEKNNQQTWSGLNRATISMIEMSLQHILHWNEIFTQVSTEFQHKVLESNHNNIWTILRIMSYLLYFLRGIATGNANHILTCLNISLEQPINKTINDLFTSSSAVAAATAKSSSYHDEEYTLELLHKRRDIWRQHENRIYRIQKHALKSIGYDISISIMYFLTCQMFTERFSKTFFQNTAKERHALSLLNLESILLGNLSMLQENIVSLLIKFIMFIHKDIKQHNDENERKRQIQRELEADEDYSGDENDDSLNLKPYDIEDVLNETLLQCPLLKDDEVTLWNTVGCKNICQHIAEDITTYFNPFINNETTTTMFYDSIQIMAHKHKQALPRAIALNNCDQRYLCVATVKGVREINVQSTLNFRQRSLDSGTLVGDDLETWAECLHRYDHLELDDKSGVENHAYPIPINRMIAYLQTPASYFDTSIDKMNNNNDDDNIHTRILKGFTKDAPKDIKNVLQSLGLPAEITRDCVVTRLASHPNLPLYVSGGANGNVYVWEFGRAHALAQIDARVNLHMSLSHLNEDECVFTVPILSPISSPNTKMNRSRKHVRTFTSSFTHERQLTRTTDAKIRCIRFSDTGDKLGIMLSNGILYIYTFLYQPKHHSFNTNNIMDQLPLIQPYQVVMGPKNSYDFTFITHGSLIATCGESGVGNDIIVWDTMLPGGLKQYHVYKCGSTHGITSICYVPNGKLHLLVAGGSKGQIYIYSLDWGHVLVHTIEAAHVGRVSALCFDAISNEFISCGHDGHVKCWSTSSFKLKRTFELFSKKTFFNHPSTSGMMSTFGVTDIQVTDGFIVASGSDGTVHYIKRKFALQ